MPALILAVVFAIIIAALASMLGWATYKSRRIHSRKTRRARSEQPRRVNPARLQVSRH